MHDLSSYYYALQTWLSRKKSEKFQVFRLLFKIKDILTSANTIPILQDY